MKTLPARYGMNAHEIYVGALARRVESLEGGGRLPVPAMVQPPASMPMPPKRQAYVPVPLRRQGRMPATVLPVPSEFFEDS
jgi:hypothetical protein